MSCPAGILWGLGNHLLHFRPRDLPSLEDLLYPGRVRSVLLAWLGRTDLECSSRKKEALGPIATAVVAESFREIILLSNYSEEENRTFEKWLQQYSATQIRIVPRKLPNEKVIDHEAVYEQAVPVIEEALKRHGYDVPLTYHLSPGTPAMAHIWVLLGKSTYPARLIQTTRDQEGFQEANIPFNIATDFRAVLRHGDQRLLHLLQGSIPDSLEASKIIHDCIEMKEALALAARAAPREFPALILGESGTGKELVARLIHSSSDRASHPFVCVNSGAIPSSLLDSQLFGHKRGSFTGAERDALGFFHEVKGGTLFLDEIGELSGDAQVRLLRVLQEREFYRLGSTRPEKTSARIIAATNRDLLSEVATGKFRADLFYRLAFAVIQLPPLRERGAKDIDLLADHFLGELNEELRKGAAPGAVEKSLSNKARNLLRAHDWPGNVRELQTTLARSSLFSLENKVTESDVRRSILEFPQNLHDIASRQLGPGFCLPEIVKEFERLYIRKALSRAKTQKEASELLGLNSSQALKYRIDSVGI